MNVFELGLVASPIIGAAIGIQSHTIIGVGLLLGGFIGAAIGVASYFILIFMLAAILSLVTGKPFFKPKKRRPEDA
jgi:hypothetical protein